MKALILPALIVAALISGCSSAYKATRTPDDVYYSPAPAAKESDEDRYESYSSNNEDRYLRMKVRNRYQWDAIDDYSYWNDSRYDFGYGCSPSRSVLLNPYNPYIGFGYAFYSPWGSWYSPYSTIVYYKNPNVFYGRTTKTNLTCYRNGNYNNTNNRNTTFGSLLNKAFSNNNSNSSYNLNNNNNTPTRTFNSTPSSNAGGRSSGFNSSGSSAGSSRTPRGGK